MELVHSISIYDSDTKRDVFVIRERMELKKDYTPDDEIVNFVYNADLDWEFIIDVAELIRDRGIEVAKEYVSKKYPQYKKGEVIA